MLGTAFGDYAIDICPDTGVGMSVSALTVLSNDIYPSSMVDIHITLFRMLGDAYAGAFQHYTHEYRTLWRVGGQKTFYLMCTADRIISVTARLMRFRCALTLRHRPRRI